MNKAFALDRRRLLRCVSLGAVAPYLAPLVCRAASDAAGKKPMRFVFLVEGNGLAAAHIQPVGIERKQGAHAAIGGFPVNTNETLIDKPLNSPGVSLPEPIAPLARHLRRLTLITGLSSRVCGGGHGNGFGSLGCYPAQSGPKDITIDAALARATPAIHQHVALGLNTDLSPQAPPIFYSCSASAPNSKVPHFQDAMLAHDVLFGTILAAERDAEVGAQALVLDHLAKEASQLARRLPHEESHRLQQYAEGVASVGKRQSRLGEIDPAKIPPRRQDFHGSMIETKRLEAHFELAAAALITGLTNVVTISTASYRPIWRALGADKEGHDLAHSCGDLRLPPNSPSEIEARKARTRIRQFHAEQLATLVDKLSAIPEGDGSMMDNTLIIHTGDGEEHHSQAGEWPLLVLGDLGGRLKLGNRFLNASTYQARGHATVAQFYTAVLHAAGAPVDHFGMKDRLLSASGIKQDGPWAEVLA